jgi:ribonuclease P protein component
MTFTESNRIQKHKINIKINLKSSQRLTSKSLNLLVKRNTNLNSLLVSVIISKKVIKSSVVRNKYKRRLKEVFRNHYKDKLINYELIIMPKSSIVKFDFWEMKKELDLVLKKLLK